MHSAEMVGLFFKSWNEQQGYLSVINERFSQSLRAVSITLYEMACERQFKVCRWEWNTGQKVKYLGLLRTLCLQRLANNLHNRLAHTVEMVRLFKIKAQEMFSCFTISDFLSSLVFPTQSSMQWIFYLVIHLFIF